MDIYRYLNKIACTVDDVRDTGQINALPNEFDRIQDMPHPEFQDRADPPTRQLNGKIYRLE